MAAKKTVTANFKIEKNTKNMVRFEAQTEKDDADLTPYVYIRNAAVKKLGNPEKIKVTIEAG
jgi:hypothetical protein